MMQYPIDFVILYCDGSDPAFLAKKRAYETSVSDADDPEFGDARYRDVGTLHYWFRAVEANAPWVRTIHLVTDNQVPDWIVRDHPKLHLVNHTDIIPHQYLPTFNSCAIESFIHRIQGLAEHFVYFNDDMFLNAPVSPESFFLHGLPRHSPCFTNHPSYGFSSWYYHIYNDYRFVNSHCKSRKSYLRVIMHSIGRAYGFKQSRINFILLVAGLLSRSGYPFLRLPHQAVPMLRSTFELLWSIGEEELLATASHRFRDCSSINQSLFSFYDILSGRFEPSFRTHYYTMLGTPRDAKMLSHLCAGSVEMLCINDGVIADSAPTLLQLQQVFQKRYPQPSSFERTNACDN